MKVNILLLFASLSQSALAQTGQDCYAPGVDVTNLDACNFWCGSTSNSFSGQGTGDQWTGVSCSCQDGSKSCSGSYVMPTCQEAGLASCDFDGSTCDALCNKWINNEAANTCNDSPSSPVTCQCGPYYVCKDVETVAPIPVQDCYQPGVEVTNQMACQFWCGPDGSNNFIGQGKGDRWLGVRCQCLDWDGKLTKTCEGSYATPDCKTAGMFDCSYEGATCEALCSKWINSNEGTTCSPDPNLSCKCGDYHVCKPGDYEDCGIPSIAVSDGASCNTWCGGEGTFFSFGTAEIDAGRACGCLDANDSIIKACVTGELPTKGEGNGGGDTGGGETEESGDENGETEESGDAGGGETEPSSAPRRGQVVAVVSSAVAVVSLALL